MAHDLEERLRRSLATRVRDVEPDPAMWETVHTRIRRRAYARWTATGAVAVAALVLAALVLPGLLTGTRVDLTPADTPDAGTPLSATGLVTTDGRTFTVSDAQGDWVRELDPPTENPEPLPIARLAVRPGSTADDLTMVYVRADNACERVEIAWTRERQPDPAKDLEFIGLAGTLGGGQGRCATDPVWSPDGRTVAWVEQEPAQGGHTFALHLHAWTDEGDGGPGDSASARSRHVLASPDLTALRATGWHAEESADGGTAGIIALSGRRADGPVQAFTLPFVQKADGDLELGTTLEPAEPHLDGAVRSAMLALEPAGSGPAGGYDLGVDGDGTVVLSRIADNAEPLRLPLGADVLTAEDIDGGAAWLGARGDTVVLGVAGDAWTVRWRDEADGSTRREPQQLPGSVVHAAPVADSRPAGQRADEGADEPTREPMSPAAPSPLERAPTAPLPTAGLPRVVTDGEAITLNHPGVTVRVTAVEGDITDFAVHPTSTADDITVAWREGSGCDARLHWVRMYQGARAASGTLPATCPGRPVFAPDGNHLAWISQGQGPEEGTFVLESLPWWTGPYAEVQTFTLRADPAETVALDLLDWVWTEGMEAETAGVLHLSGHDSHGTRSAYTAPIARHNDDHPGDPQLVLPDSAAAEQVTPFRFDDGQERSAILRVDSHHNDGAAVGPEYTLEQRARGDSGRDLVVVRGGDGDRRDEVVLPEGLLRVNAPGEVDDVWMTARGDDVLLGDGAGRAWRLPWAGDGWGEPQRLDGAVRYALPFAG